MKSFVNIPCPVCNGKSKVNRSVQDDADVVRRRRCLACGYVFYTTEADCDATYARPLFRALESKRSRERWKKWEEKRRNEHST